MATFQKFRNIFPIPKPWEQHEEKKQFCIRLNDAYRWLQMRCDIFAKRTLDFAEISGNSNKTFDIVSNGRYLFIIDGVDTNTKDILIVSCSNSGDIGCVRAVNGVALTIDTSATNKIKLTNGGTHKLQVFIERLL